jgi:hypothetical protein
VRHPVASQSVAHNRRQLTASRPFVTMPTTLSTPNRCWARRHPTCGGSGDHRDTIGTAVMRLSAHSNRRPPTAHRTRFPKMPSTLLDFTECACNVSNFDPCARHQLVCTSTSTRFRCSTVSRARREDGVAGQSFLRRGTHTHTHTHTHTPRDTHTHP